MDPTALVLAAGRGRRFAASGGAGPKSLAAVAGDTAALPWTLGTLRDSGVDDVTVVLGHDGDRIRAAVDRVPGLGRVHFVRNDRWERTDSAYSFALGASRPGPLLLTYADVFVRPALVRRMLDGGDRDLLAVDRTRPRSAWDMHARVGTGRVGRLGKSLPTGSGESACLFRFRDETRRLLAAAARRTAAAGGRVPFETVLDGLLDAVPVAPVWCGPDEWCEVDTVADLGWAEQVVAAERAAAGPRATGAGRRRP